MKTAIRVLLAAALCVGMVVAASATSYQSPYPSRSPLLDYGAVYIGEESYVSPEEVLRSVVLQAKQEVENGADVSVSTPAPPPVPPVPQPAVYSSILAYLLGK